MSGNYSAAAFRILQQPEFKSVRSGVRACFADSGKIHCSERWSSMTIRGRSRLSLSLGYMVLILLSPNSGVGQAPDNNFGEAPLTLSQVVDKLAEKNAERAKALEHYQGKRMYQLDYKGFPTDMHAEMTVNVSYDAPAKEEFTVVSQSGPKWMINRVLKRLLETERESLKDENRERVQITSENYAFTLLETQDAGDGCSYVLGVQPKVVNKFLFRGKIWVDAKDFAVCRIEAEPAKNPSFWIKKTAIHHSFLKIGDFWLPAENRSVSNTRLDGHATLTIKYEDYEIHAAPAFKAATTRLATPN
jgi:hypothetical protein